MAEKQKGNQYNIEWTLSSMTDLYKTLDYIAEQSIQNAEAVLNSVNTCLEKAALNPEINPAYKYKLNNKGNCRSFEIKKCRVTYLIVKNRKVIKVRFRSTKQKPSQE